MNGFCPLCGLFLLNGDVIRHCLKAHPKKRYLYKLIWKKVIDGENINENICNKRI